ncbi:glycosyltransferase [Geodermatophilus tzadiensis]|uniref:glycosyltransferase n=1 Tax=Geodermatophilus tzadiensis TaxID=1137988 RepID=UPI000D06FCC2|nr:glycosyltransferase [Geodermatophilus tzadiensis]
MRSRQRDGALVVLQSFPRPRPTTNPYLVMLGRSLAELPDVRVLTFSWRRALRGGYSVFHVHWPEILVSGTGPLKKAVRQLLFAVLLLRLRATRTPLVRTVHNLELPAGISRREVALLRWAERWTTLRIRLNDETPVPAGAPARTVVHGHYRDWFAGRPRAAARPGRLAFVGLLRHYKGVDRLVAAFAGTAGRTEHPLELRVSGSPSTPELGAELVAAAAADPRVSVSLGFLADDDLVAEVTAAELVVLPYREMHNSGGTLAALSLDRPVLVPDNPVNERLAAEVGPGWVHRYAGELTAGHLVDAVTALRAAPPAAPPDLSGRDWDRVGEAHAAAYRQALGELRG